jgi:hypothetical protein
VCRTSDLWRVVGSGLVRFYVVEPFVKTFMNKMNQGIFTDQKVVVDQLSPIASNFKPKMRGMVLQ